MIKSIRIFLLILIIIGLALIFTRNIWLPKVVDIIITYENSTAPKPVVENKPEAVSITTVNIKEENFTGKKSVIAGDGLLALESNKFINSTVGAFKAQADLDVPNMRKQFGADNPTANYTIDIVAKQLLGAKTEATVISVYTYTGGAHGSSYYKVFNVSVPQGSLLSLADVVKNDMQSAFTDIVKRELNNWKPEDSVVVFPESVNALTFTSFKNWTLDDKNITIYFDQYEIGPGVLGAVAFPISLEKVNSLLN